MGTQEFNRIRVGVGRPLNGEPVVNYVLSGYRKEELVNVEEAIEKTSDAVVAWLKKPFLEVMNDFN